MLYSAGSGVTSTGTVATKGGVITQVPPFELASTNLLLQSADFATTWAVAGGLTVTSNSTASPRGVVEADTLVDAAGTMGSVFQNVVVPNDALTRTFSAYFLAGTSTQAQIGVLLTGGVGKSALLDFNPASGAIISLSADVAASLVEAVSIGGVTWFRVSVAVANNGSGNVTAICGITPASLSAATQGTVIVWGAQLETGSSLSTSQPAPTTQIPTLAAQVTRAAGLIPIWETAGLYTIQVFTVGATYTAPANLKFAKVTVVGGGGAGGGAVGNIAGGSHGSGGCSGGAGIRLMTAAQIGVSQVVTVGAGGTGVAAGTGNTGATSSFGALVSATGGGGGAAAPSTAGQDGANTIVAPGVGSSGDVNLSGSIGGSASGAFNQYTSPGQGGASFVGGGGLGASANNTDGSAAPANSGGGGGGAAVNANATNRTGGAGGSGIVFVEEFY